MQDCRAVRTNVTSQVTDGQKITDQDEILKRIEFYEQLYNSDTQTE